MWISDRYIQFKEYLKMAIRMLMLVLILYMFYSYYQMNQVTQLRLQAATVEKQAAIEGYVHLKNIIDQQTRILEGLDSEKGKLKRELNKQGVIKPDMVQ